MKNDLLWKSYLSFYRDQKNGHRGPLLNKTGLQNRTNKNYITSKTADKTAIESRMVIQKTKKKKNIHRKIDKTEAYFR